MNEPHYPVWVVVAPAYAADADPWGRVIAIFPPHERAEADAMAERRDGHVTIGSTNPITCQTSYVVPPLEPGK
jgi:hypothetical protein